MASEQLSKLISNLYIAELNIGNLTDISSSISFKNIIINESIDKLIPTCSLDLIFPISVMNQVSKIISDGTLITITLKTKEDFQYFNINETYNFRVYQVGDIQVDNLFCQFTIYGMFDCYKIFEDGNKYNAKANTSEIVCKIAGACGLECDKDGTSDKQLWIAGEKNARDFIKYMAKYGYAGDTSGMFWCITRNKKLLYKDIVKAFNSGCSNGGCKTLVPAAGYNKDSKYIHYTSISSNILNGENNVKHDGYGAQDKYFTLKDYKLKNATCNKTCACSSCCNVNKELSNGLSSMWPGFDIGNTYEKYYQAPRQNARTLAMFSTHIEAYCQFMQTPLNIGDIVNVYYSNVYDPEHKYIEELKLLSGKAIVTSHNLEISPLGVSSYVGLTIQGLNANAQNEGSY